MKHLYLCLSFLLLNLSSFAQDENSSYAYKTFKDTRLINGQTIETEEKGVLKFIISHRFGTIDGGIDELFGLDIANIRLGFDYGITDRLMVGIGRSNVTLKPLDAYIKYKLLLQQESRMPITLTLYSSVGTNLDQDSGSFQNKSFFTFHPIVGRKFSDRFSLQLSPSLVLRNSETLVDDKTLAIALGVGGKYQITKTLAILGEYFFAFPNQLVEGYYNSVGIGLEIETHGHIFQLNFTNSVGMTEKVFITDTRDDSFDGKIRFGFNITRKFRVGGRNY
jgi:hypothetical protein